MAVTIKVETSHQGLRIQRAIRARLKRAATMWHGAGRWEVITNATREEVRSLPWFIEEEGTERPLLFGTITEGE